LAARRGCSCGAPERNAGRLFEADRVGLDPPIGPGGKRRGGAEVGDEMAGREEDLELVGAHLETLNYVKACHDAYLVVQYVDGNRVYYPWDAILRVREEQKPIERGFHAGID